MKSNKLYVLISSHRENSYWWTNIKCGLLKGALLHKYRIFYLTSEMLEEPCFLGGEMVLVVGHDTDWINASVEKLLSLKAIPILASTSMLEGQRRLCSGIILGIEDAMGEAVRYLRDSGRKKIAFLGANPGSVSDRIKCQIFGCPEDIIIGKDGIEKCVEDFCNSFASLGYDAVLCANDTVAICLMKRMEELGYRIPEDIFIIGMGNSFIGQGMRIPLASIDFNYFEMGKQAVNLFHLIKNSESEYKMLLTLECKLIIRESARISKESESEKEEIAESVDALQKSRYFEGEKVKSILSLEAFLQSFEETDGQILVGLMKKKPIKKIAEETFLGERAVRYRIKNIIEQRKFKDKDELIAFLTSVTNTEIKHK